MRSAPSGVSETCVIARFAIAGNAANKIPSMANTRPIATRKSDIDAAGAAVAVRNRRQRGVAGAAGVDETGGPIWRLPSRCLPGRIDEVTEELRIRLQHHPRIVVAHAVLVGLHRAVESKELGPVASERLGENAVALAIALAAKLLALRGRLGHQHGDVAIGLGADLLRLLAALGAEFGGLALTLGLHALIDRLAVLVRQVGAADTHVHHGNPVHLRLLVELLAHPRHQLRAVVAHNVGERGLAQHAPQRGVEQHRELRIGALDRVDGLVEAQRLVDPVACKSVHHEALLVGSDHLLRRIFQVEDALVDADHRIDQRHLEVEAGLRHDANRLTEPHHQRLLGLIDGEQR